jgi:hypothetical protein
LRRQDRRSFLDNHLVEDAKNERIEARGDPARLPELLHDRGPLVVFNDAFELGVVMADLDRKWTRELRIASYSPMEAALSRCTLGSRTQELAGSLESKPVGAPHDQTGTSG